MTQKAVKVIRKQRKVGLYQKYKDATHPAYRQAQKKAKVQLKKAKKEFEKKLAKKYQGGQKIFLCVCTKQEQDQSKSRVTRRQSRELAQ